eukprot:365535-Chlamydomonas_euryale.AAC.92
MKAVNSVVRHHAHTTLERLHACTHAWPCMPLAPHTRLGAMHAAAAGEEVASCTRPNALDARLDALQANMRSGRRDEPCTQCASAGTPTDGNPVLARQHGATL